MSVAASQSLPSPVLVVKHFRALLHEGVVNTVVIEPLGKRSIVGLGMLPNPGRIGPINRARVADLVVPGNWGKPLGGSRRIARAAAAQSLGVCAWTGRAMPQETSIPTIA